MISGQILRIAVSASPVAGPSLFFLLAVSPAANSIGSPSSSMARPCPLRLRSLAADFTLNLIGRRTIPLTVQRKDLQDRTAGRTPQAQRPRHHSGFRAEVDADGWPMAGR
ncbi:MAG: hypothetical protein CMJ23_12750 [Phycisphaerae bacterium]|nr:hypothetical protein [Phycisphaerae bacterium]